MSYRAYHSLDTVPIFPVSSRGVRGICYRSPRGDGGLVGEGRFPAGPLLRRALLDIIAASLGRLRLR